ncbi:MAG: tRNA (adenine(22)-N(1))-methyltransferase [Myxococcota bacterium]
MRAAQGRHRRRAHLGRGPLNALPLSARLAAVAALVPEGRPVADIGTDHGRLPAWLVASGRVPRAIGIDDKEAPLAGARRMVARFGLDVALRQARGCAGLAAGEVATVTVAGMGGASIVDIVAGAPDGVERVVLQPNNGEAAVRAWLGAHGWAIDAEHAVWDRGRWFAVLRAGRGEGVFHDGADLAYGRVAVHVDRDALRGRLEADAQRLDALLAAHTEAAARAALTEQRAVVTCAMGRLGPGADASRGRTDPTG